MVSKFYKWLMASFVIVVLSASGRHPIYVSVTEIEHNGKNNSLEVSCKIFTDDFEKTLRMAYKTNVDLLKPKNRDAMNKLVNDYVQKHLSIDIDGKKVALKFIGYEEIEEGIYSYYQADNIGNVKHLTVTDNILYEYKNEQISLLHVTVNNNRKSTKLNNPEDKAIFEF